MWVFLGVGFLGGCTQKNPPGVWTRSLSSVTVNWSPGPVSTRIGDRRQTGKPSRSVTSHLGQLSLAIPSFRDCVLCADGLWNDKNSHRNRARTVTSSQRHWSADSHRQRFCYSPFNLNPSRLFLLQLNSVRGWWLSIVVDMSVLMNKILLFTF